MRGACISDICHTPPRPNTDSNPFHLSSSHSLDAALPLYLHHLGPHDEIHIHEALVGQSYTRTQRGTKALSRFNSCSHRWGCILGSRFRPESRSPSLHPLCHHCEHATKPPFQHAAQPPFQPQPRCSSCTFFFQQRCHTHSTPLCYPVTTKHLTLALALALAITLAISITTTITYSCGLPNHDLTL